MSEYKYHPRDNFVLTCLIRDLPQSEWKYIDTSKITDIRGVFAFRASLKDLSPIANWDVSNVTDMRWMFSECYSLKDLSPLKNWNVSGVRSMRSMFSQCTIGICVM